MTARRIAGLAAAALGAGALTFGSAAVAGTPESNVTKATAFTTPDGKLACAFDQRDNQTKCVNTTAGWKDEPGVGNLRDVDGQLIAQNPFTVSVDPTTGVNTPGVSTQGVSFDSVAKQTWHGTNGPTKHVRIATNGFGDYVDQDFAVAKTGQKLTFPDGLEFTVTGDHAVDVMTHPDAGANVPWAISSDGISNDEPSSN